LERPKAPRQQPNNAAADMPPCVAVFRAARALIGLPQIDLAAVPGVSIQAIARLERYPDGTRLPCKRGTWQRLLGPSVVVDLI
jgi:DNA-binding XRE family transcriptional regulator